MNTNQKSLSSSFYSNSTENNPNYSKIVNWLNEAAVSTDPTLKVDNLRKAQELILCSSTSLLDNFLDEMLGFQNDRSSDVRKFITGFIEEACKKDADVIPKVVVNLSMLLQDNSAQVQKRVIQATGVLYKLILVWLSKAKVINDDMEAAWKVLTQMKELIIKMVDNDNDGIRTLAVKFLENLVLLQTYPEQDSLIRENDFSLEDVPFTLKIARRRILEEEALYVFDLLLKFHNSPHISSVNLMTCMGSLVLIAKMRPFLMGKVVAALETLHINLPPTLSKSQVSSVRKHLKLQLLNLLKFPSAIDYHNNITTLLTDLGATYQQVMKVYPKPEEIKKHKLKRQQASLTSDSVFSSTPALKKPKLEVEVVEGEDDDDDDDDDRVTAGDVEMAEEKIETAIDITERFVLERLGPEMACNLVMAAMIKLPDVMPPHFSATYTPIAAAGTKAQIKHLSRLIATQLTAASLGPGVKLAKKQVKPMTVDEEEEDVVQKPGRAAITTVISGCVADEPAPVVKPPPPTLQPSGPKFGKILRLKTLKLSELVKPLSETVRSTMMTECMKRVLNSEVSAVQAGAGQTRSKIITTMSCTFNKQIRAATLEYILDDVRKRIDLALSWLYEEHSLMQGFNRCPAILKQDVKPDENYNTLLCTLISHIVKKCKFDSRDKEILLHRLYLETPLISEEAMDLLKEICSEEAQSAMGLKLLQELVVRKPPRQMHYLNALLVQTAHESNIIRSEAISVIVNLFSRRDLSNIIEEYAVFYLGFLKLQVPPDVVFGTERGRPNKSDVWTEETIKVCSYLFMALLPINEKLIHELAKVYVSTSSDVKRTILRLLEQPVRGMGMNSPELLTLVEECPKGAETLVTRIIHILTDKVPPSQALVNRVRDLYKSRVPDVRFLIPVLNGLSLEEVVDALPKLLKLNPIVVKEVFNRLLGVNNDGSGDMPSPISPAELLVALHTIDSSLCDLKLVIKATSLCFTEKQIYTQEVLAVVLQQLMEIDPLPTLLMRTVIQSLTLYPRLIGFIMNILQRLIVKQVWNQKKVWEGFIKCCQRTKPRSYQVLLQLPAPQLSEVLQECCDLRAGLYDHVMTFTDNQKAHIPQDVMDVVTYKVDENIQPAAVTQILIDVKTESVENETGIPPPPGIEC